ncbi:hypothetical protein PR048_028807 [Dryococelus australis]|uniref:Uncharacterized protein n=1 Tax=Dryococelus australis TaxID=614101 RepID=A0ABQ9GBK4_9NEOP|nr:hypothetical protein PR048_028807 [Dryococelus australis]
MGGEQANRSATGASRVLYGIAAPRVARRTTPKAHADNTAPNLLFLTSLVSHSLFYIVPAAERTLQYVTSPLPSVDSWNVTLPTARRNDQDFRSITVMNMVDNKTACPHSSGVGWPTYSRRVAGSRPGASDVADAQLDCRTGSSTSCYSLPKRPPSCLSQIRGYSRNLEHVLLQFRACPCVRKLLYLEPDPSGGGWIVTYTGSEALGENVYVNCYANSTRGYIKKYALWPPLSKSVLLLATKLYLIPHPPVYSRMFFGEGDVRFANGGRGFFHTLMRRNYGHNCPRAIELDSPECTLTVGLRRTEVPDSRVRRRRKIALRRLSDTDKSIGRNFVEHPIRCRSTASCFTLIGYGLSRSFGDEVGLMLCAALATLASLVTEVFYFTLDLALKKIRFPTGSLQDFRMWESCRTISTFSRPCIPALLHDRITSLIGSQDLDVKSRISPIVAHVGSRLLAGPRRPGCIMKTLKECWGVRFRVRGCRDHVACQSGDISSCRIASRDFAPMERFFLPQHRLGYRHQEFAFPLTRGSLRIQQFGSPGGSRMHQQDKQISEGLVLFLHIRLAPRGKSTESLQDFCKWESCRTVPLVGGFSRDLPFFSPLHSGADPFVPHFTLIGSQDLAIKS